MGTQKNNGAGYKNLTVKTKVFSEAEGHALSKITPILHFVSH